MCKEIKSYKDTGLSVALLISVVMMSFTKAIVSFTTPWTWKKRHSICAECLHLVHLHGADPVAGALFPTVPVSTSTLEDNLGFALKISAAVGHYPP